MLDDKSVALSDILQGAQELELAILQGVPFVGFSVGEFRVPDNVSCAPGPTARMNVFGIMGVGSYRSAYGATPLHSEFSSWGFSVFLKGPQGWPA